MKRILSICGDPGGAAAVAPVLRKLSNDGAVCLENLTYSRASQIFDNHRVPHRCIPTETSLSEIARVFDRARPDLLLCGTSMNGWDLECDFLAEATDRRIPSLAVLDFWSNYRARFSSSGRGRPVFPTRIAIMDEHAREEMLGEGFEPERLVVTGQPALDIVTPAGEAPARSEFQLPEDGTIVLFVSQPLNPGVDEMHPDYPGFSKFTVLPELLAVLNDFKTRHGRMITLVVRPHPREDAEDFSWLEAGSVDVRIIRHGSSRSLARASDLIVGLNSVLLVECCLMGLPVLSLQPGLRGTDCLPTNRMGVSRAVYSHTEIFPAVEDLLENPASRDGLTERCLGWKLPRDATERVANLAMQMMQTNLSASIL